MDIQTAIVGTIILLALLYVGKIVLGKITSFSPKSSCGSNCGCGTNAKANE